jgi:hypothetical protein
MTLNHEAIRKAYPNVVTIDDGAGAFDANGNQVQLDQSKVDAAAVIVAHEQALATAQRNRAAAYASEADPLFFKAQRGEATIEEWQSTVADIRARFPYPTEEVTS